jgi:hypothetical protein
MVFEIGEGTFSMENSQKQIDESLAHEKVELPIHRSHPAKKIGVSRTIFERTIKKNNHQQHDAKP